MNIELRGLWQEAFGDTDEFLDMFAATAYAPERMNRLCTDGQTVAALYWFDCEYSNKKIAYIYAVATAKAYRGRGLCHQLMKDTHEKLREQGYAGAILVPGSKELFDLYAGMGYRICSYVQTVSCCGQGKADLRSIDKQEYAVLRRQFLPQGGVLQEGANLDFLERQANFYAGSDFVLAARQEKDILIGLELLGEVSAASGITAALDCKEGQFRVPGQGRPFAMYYALADTDRPTYFGLAFD